MDVTSSTQACANRPGKEATEAGTIQLAAPDPIGPLFDIEAVNESSPPSPFGGRLRV
jgi:hypothetical protein